MLDEPVTIPDDPEELRSFTARLPDEVKAQAVLIESCVISWPGIGRIGSGRPPKPSNSCNLPWRPARSRPRQ